MYKNKKIGWFGQRTYDALGLEHYFDLNLILSCDYGLDSDILSNITKAKIYSIEAGTYVRENWTSQTLDRIIIAFQEKLINDLIREPEPVYLLSYNASSMLEDLQKRTNSIQVFMPEPNLKLILDDKLFFYDTVQRLRLPSINGIVLKASNIRFQNLKSNFGTPFVLQLRFGSSGSGTFMVKNQSDLKFILDGQKDDFILVTQFIQNNVSINLNAAIIGKKVLKYYPSIQLVGLKKCSNKESTYCGNDYSAISALDKIFVEKAFHYTEIIGNWLIEIGYEGLFGIDFVADLDTNQLFPVDLNARFQNSTNFQTQFDLRHDLLPLPILYIYYKLGLVGEREIIAWDLSHEDNICGAQIVLHSIEHDETVSWGELAPGIYKYSDDEIYEFQPGISLTDIKSDNQVLVTCGVPRVGTKIISGAPLLKLFFCQEVFDLARRDLKLEYNKLCELIYHKLELKSNNQSHRIPT